MTDPIPEAFLAQLWSLLTDPDPDAIARSVGPPWRPRLARHPRRLRLPRQGRVVRLQESKTQPCPKDGGGGGGTGWRLFLRFITRK